MNRDSPKYWHKLQFHFFLLVETGILKFLTECSFDLHVLLRNIVKPISHTTLKVLSHEIYENYVCHVLYTFVCCQKQLYFSLW